MYLGADDTVDTDRRGSRAAIPTDIDDVLTQEQRTALLRVESFGWQLAFVRQPLFQAAITVVVSPDRQRYAVLGSDGELDLEPDISVRH